MIIVLILAFLIFSPLLLRNVADNHYKSIVVTLSVALCIAWGLSFFYYRFLVSFTPLILFHFSLKGMSIPFGVYLYLESWGFCLFSTILYTILLFSIFINLRSLVPLLSLMLFSLYGAFVSLSMIQLLLFFIISTSLIFFIKLFIKQSHDRFLLSIYSYAYLSDVLLFISIVLFGFYILLPFQIQNQQTVLSFINVYLLVFSILIVALVRSMFFLNYLFKKIHDLDKISFTFFAIEHALTLFLLYILTVSITESIYYIFCVILFIVLMVNICLQIIIVLKTNNRSFMVYLVLAGVFMASYYALFLNIKEPFFITTLLLTMVNLFIYGVLWITYHKAYGYHKDSIEFWKLYPKFFILWIGNVVTIFSILVYLFTKQSGFFTFYSISLLVMLAFISFHIGLVTGKMFFTKPLILLKEGFRIQRQYDDLSLTHFMYSIIYLIGTIIFNFIYLLFDHFISHILLSIIYSFLFLLCGVGIALINKKISYQFFRLFSHTKAMFHAIFQKQLFIAPKEYTDSFLKWVKNNFNTMVFNFKPIHKEQRIEVHITNNPAIKVVVFIVIALACIFIAWYGVLKI